MVPTIAITRNNNSPSDRWLEVRARLRAEQLAPARMQTERDPEPRQIQETQENNNAFPAAIAACQHERSQRDRGYGYAETRINAQFAKDERDRSKFRNEREGS